MSRFCLCLARILLAAWVGAAVLFVINGVSLVGQFPSDVFDRLLAIRFPNYYRFGFVAVGTGLAALLCSLVRCPLPRLRVAIAALLVGGALGVMVYDYQHIYRPLEAMITPPGQVRPMEFVPLHKRSKYVNSVHVGLCLLASITLCWPPRVVRKDEPAAQ
jgi:hypothetical protein